MLINKFRNFVLIYSLKIARKIDNLFRLGALFVIFASERVKLERSNSM